MRPAGMLFLFLSVAASAPVSGQTVPLLDSATRVRVTAPARGLNGQIATVLGQRADTLWLRTLPKGATLTLTTPELSRLEVSRGRHGHALRGAGFGFVAGAAVGAALAYAFPSREEDCYFCGDRGFDTAAGAVTGAIPGAVIGAIIGANQKTDQWRLVVAAPVTVVSATSGASLRMGLGLKRAF